jgi:uncharacterized protein (DUF1684 family)
LSIAVQTLDLLDLLDWKRRVFELYAEIRSTAQPRKAWQRWRDVRSELYRTHPQSPVPAERRGSFAGPEYFPYDPELRVLADVTPAPAEPRGINGSAGSSIVFARFARAEFTLAGEAHSLELYWLQGYGGGAFLPLTDETSGVETYAGGRYLLDTVKGADLGSTDGRLVLDFNFAYQPSCAYDGHWACPLAPPANRLPLAVRGGERMER